MKIAIPSTGKTLENQISQVFGRCPFYILVEISKNEEKGEKEIKTAEAIENPAVGQRGGAGIAASQALGNEDINAVLATRIGPRAFDVLNRIGIKTYEAIEGTVQQNINKFIKGELKEINQPGQMGMGPKPGAGKGTGTGQGQGRGQRRAGGTGQRRSQGRSQSQGRPSSRRGKRNGRQNK